MAVQLQNAQGQVFGPAGANHSQGLVPDPGSTADSAGANRFLRSDSTWDQVDYASITGTPSLRTYQTFTSGTGTYTPPAGVLVIKVRMCGGGAGGGSTGSTGINSGGDSGFGSTTAKGATSSAGGTGGTTGTGTQIFRIPGGTGASGTIITAAGQQVAGAVGGSSFFGNTGAPGGGGQGSNSAGASSSSGNGGGAGEYVEFFLTSPTAQTYTVGAGGNSPGSGGLGGGHGIILVEEFYS
jgi:hypothetical protein